MVGATKPLKASGISILGVISGKEITRALAGLTTGESTQSFFIPVKNWNLETKVIANIRKLRYIWKRIIPGKQIFMQ